ncbi:MAG: hypothetical protein H0W68_02515, partial [Gemmatimonadaceae bacterium]|nr:hypothetical protein [Gemmatimonadaceae bacterium]
GRDRLSWGVRGAAAGALSVGLITAIVLGRENPGTLAGIAGLVAGRAVGGAGGALVGTIVAPERWRELPMTRHHR